jgi:hypothetical protein
MLTKSVECTGAECTVSGISSASTGSTTLRASLVDLRGVTWAGGHLARIRPISLELVAGGSLEAENNVILQAERPVGAGQPRLDASALNAIGTAIACAGASCAERAGVSATFRHNTVHVPAAPTGDDTSIGLNVLTAALVADNNVFLATGSMVGVAIATYAEGRITSLHGNAIVQVPGIAPLPILHPVLDFRTQGQPRPS